MHRNHTIRSILAAALLLIFSFSITPKIYLHDLFAGHKDVIAKTTNDGKAEVSQTGFNCDCNTLVATSPFTEYTDEISLIIPGKYPSLFISLGTAVCTSSHSFIELRGPPSLG